MERAKKAELIAELHAKLARASTAVLTDYKGLSVEQITQLRDALAEQGVEYRVVKNTLLRLASAETPAESLQPLLTGTNAVAFGYGDPSVPAKILKKYAKDSDKLKIKAGLLGRRLLSVDQVQALADLPSRDELLAKLLGTLNAVPTGLVTVLSGVPRALVQVLAAIQKDKENA